MSGVSLGERGAVHGDLGAEPFGLVCAVCLGRDVVLSFFGASLYAGRRISIVTKTGDNGTAGLIYNRRVEACTEKLSN